MTSPLPQPIPPPPETPARYFRSRVQSVLAMTVIILFAVTFVVQAFRVPTESMENTLLVGDYLLADKLHFGDAGRMGWLLPYRKIQRGEIIVFHYPLDGSQYFVKRVIGIPGDRIHLLNGMVYVNGSPLQEDYATYKTGTADSYRDDFPAQLWTSIANVSWRSRLSEYVSHGELVVPAGDYFVLGDNRERSSDSRYWGFVPHANVVGRPLVVYLSVLGEQPPLSRASDDKLFHSGSMFAHLLQSARWKRRFILVR
jgi:signal peptidase I